MHFHPSELVVGLLAVTTAVAVLGRRMTTPFPILLVLCGTVLGLIQGLFERLPRVSMDPELIFLFFLPPLLYSGAFLTHWPDFRANLRAIVTLAVGLVLFTTAVTAVAGHFVLGLPWAAAFVLGAVVSPPDAVAATAVTQRLRVPRQITTILEGESLFNDAAGLVAFRFAVAAVVTGRFSAGSASLEFVWVGGGGLLWGLAAGWLIVTTRAWLNDRGWVTEHRLLIMLSLLTPFAVYLPAEHLGLSGVVAVVAAGLFIGRRAADLFSKLLLSESRVVWEMFEFLLNSLVFILIGLQLPVILAELFADDPQRSFTILCLQTVLIAAVVIVTRLVWMYPAAYLPRWLFPSVRRHDPYPPWQSVLVVGWTGMRGVVSLAAALALPATTETGAPFPGRALIQFVTFGVIFATLVGQGLTLPALIRWLRLGAQGHGGTHPN